MKTKKLIELLQQADPTGEEECCVGNVDILYVDRQPAYYDGNLQVLDRDIEDPFYNVTGAKFKRDGYKIKIHEFSIKDAIHEDHDLPIRFEPEYEPESQYYNHRDRERVELWRKEAIQLEQDTDKWFTEYKAIEEAKLKFFKEKTYL